MDQDMTETTRQSPRRKSPWRFLPAYLIAGLTGAAVDALCHVHIAAFIAGLPTIWVFYARERNIQDRRKDPND
jgi:membrane associated rhomboid family serine protease